MEFVLNFRFSCVIVCDNEKKLSYHKNPSKEKKIAFVTQKKNCPDCNVAHRILKFF